MRLVLALSNPSLIKMRAVASRMARTVRRERCCEADFLTFTRTFAAISCKPECEYQTRVIAHILFLEESLHNTSLEKEE